jgi:hypothetical protein
MVATGTCFGLALAIVVCMFTVPAAIAEREDIRSKSEDGEE